MKKNGKGLAITGLVLGILSLFLAWTIIIPLLGFIFSLIAIIQSRKSSQGGVKGMAIAGLVTSIIGVVLILITLGGIAFVSYSPIVDKGYAAEAEAYLKDVAAAATMYEDTYGGQQPTLDDLKQRGLLLPTVSLERDWSIEMSGDIFTATSTDEMDGGAGNTVSFNRQTGKFSGYGFENKSGK